MLLLSLFPNRYLNFSSLSRPDDPAKSEAWARGVKVATAQNFARELSEMPSNHMTPTHFVDAVSSRLGQVVREAGEPGKLAILPRSVLDWK